MKGGGGGEECEMCGRGGRGWVGGRGCLASVYIVHYSMVDRYHKFMRHIIGRTPTLKYKKNSRFSYRECVT